MIVKKELKCLNCGKDIIRYIDPCKNTKYYCSIKCRSEYWKKHDTFKGSNNPNYGRVYTQEERENRRKIAKDAYIKDPSLRTRVAVNKGKKLPGTSIGIKKYLQKHPGIRKITHHVFTKEEKIEIGKKSSAKFTSEYKLRMRKIMEDSGIWVPLDKKDDFEIYKKLSDWVDRMFDIISDEEQIKLLKEHGIFNCRNNTKGVVRDHMYSRRSGFENKVFPEILRHPCNCQILTHSDNIAKKYQRYIDADAHTLDKLFCKIQAYDKNWKEQELCLKLISDFKHGKRWSNPYKQEIKNVQ